MKRRNGHESFVTFNVAHKKSNCCCHLLKLGKGSPRMHLCLGELITGILWVRLTSLPAFVAVKKDMRVNKRAGV